MIVYRDVYGWPASRAPHVTSYYLGGDGWDDTAGDTGLFGIKLPKIKIGKAFSSISKAVGKAAKFVAKIDPVSNTLVRVAKGQRIDRALGGMVKDQRGIARAAAPVLRVVSSGASFVPGLGTAASMAMRGAAAWGEGKSLAGAALEAGQGAIPGGELTQRAISLGSRLARGERVDRAFINEGVDAASRYGGALGGAAARGAVNVARGGRVLDAVRNVGLEAVSRYGGPVASTAVRAGLDVARGKNVLSVARSAVAPVVTDQLTRYQGKTMNFLTSRLGSMAPRSMRRPLITSPAALLPSPFGQRGTLLAATLSRTPALGAMSTEVLAARTRMPRSLVSLIRSSAGLNWRGLSPRGAKFVASRSYAPWRALSRDVGGLSPDGRSYTVEKGDTGSKIAQKLVGDPNRWPELKRANPVIAARKDPPAGYTQKFGMVLWGGEVLALPDSWIKPAGAEASTAAVIQAQAILATWGKTDGLNRAGSTDYGSQPEDINGSWDARDKLMLASFANWRAKGIATDGHLTDEALGDLRAWTEEKARAVLPAPIAAALPTPASIPTPAPPAAVSMPADFTIPQQQAPASVPTARFPDLPSMTTPAALPAPPALPAPVAEPAVALPTPVSLPPAPPPTPEPLPVTPAAAPQPKSDGIALIAAGLGAAYAFGLF